MKVIKIIDLLVRIANENEIPEKIKYDNYIYWYDKDWKDYKNAQVEFTSYLISCRYHTTDFLNKEVEIIEDTPEDKKIEYFDDYKKLEEENKRLKEENKKLEEKNKTFEDYNKYLNNQLDKLEENKKLKEVNQAVKNIIKKNSIPVKENYNDYYEDTPKEDLKVDFQTSQIPNWFDLKEVIKIVNKNFDLLTEKTNRIVDKINGEE